MSKINPRFTKLFIGVAALCMAVALGVVGQAVLAKQLDTWQVPRQPERFSELYFSEHRALPKSVAPGSSHEFSFTIANHEHQITQYYYSVLARSDTGAEELLARGTATLAHNDVQTISKTVTVPPLSPRMQIAVRIDYKGAEAGKGETSKQHSIHHWLHIADIKRNGI